MSTSFRAPDRTARISHLDECYVLFVRNQQLLTATRTYDAFAGPERDWKRINEMDRVVRNYADGIADTFGVYDFRERVPDLEAVKEETLTVITNLFDGYYSGEKR